MTTSWDVLDRRWPEEDGGAGASDDDVLSPVAYRERILDDFTTVTDELLAAGVGRVVWLEMPMTQPEWLPTANVQKEPARHTALHEAMASIASASDGRVQVIDFDGWFTASGLDDDRDARPDGIHLTPDAATDIVDTWLGEQILRAALT